MDVIGGGGGNPIEQNVEVVWCVMYEKSSCSWFENIIVAQLIATVLKQQAIDWTIF